MEHILVPASSVDDVLRTDQHRDGSAALTLYLLNPSAVDDTGEKYAYTYDAPSGK